MRTVSWEHPNEFTPEMLLSHSAFIISLALWFCFAVIPRHRDSTHLSQLSQTPSPTLCHLTVFQACTIGCKRNLMKIKGHAGKGQSWELNSNPIPDPVFLPATSFWLLSLSFLSPFLLSFLNSFLTIWIFHILFLYKYLLSVSLFNLFLSYQTGIKIPES